MKESKIKVFLTVDVEHSIGGAFNNPNLKPVGNKKTRVLQDKRKRLRYIFNNGYFRNKWYRRNFFS